jgi:hypothetical protein
MRRAVGEDGAFQHRFRSGNADGTVADLRGVDQGSQVSLPERDFALGDVPAQAANHDGVKWTVVAAGAGARWTGVCASQGCVSALPPAHASHKENKREHPSSLMLTVGRLRP